MNNKRGFTLLEILAVVLILSLIAGLVITKISGRVDDAKIETTKVQMKEIKRNLELYKLDNGNYPSSEQGLAALNTKPSGQPEPKKWKQYLEALPKDAWGNEFVYICPAETNPFDLKSKGADGELNSADDISVWKNE